MEPTANVPWLGLSDPVAAITHALAAIAALRVIVRLWNRSAGQPTRRLSVLIFGFSTFFLFAASGSYHALHEPWKAWFRRVDHAAIYVLIAGTFTPLVAHLTGGRMRLYVLLWIWSLAACGIVLKLFFFDAVPEWVDVILYLGMGWSGVVPCVPILRSRDSAAVAWMGAGGAFYTVGALAELFRWPSLAPGIFGYHEILHLGVIAGSGGFLGAVLRHVVPHGRSPSAGTSQNAPRITP